ncbi:SDR family NAD(P)-dependent oxidoreductase [Tomitella biformata]|uniref:SDR family NAD(P)-dependent oxidoreductase n=1 Tax=Tomitella biformata TaxID=630403 RepID=UPI000463E41D|nr:SDR family NAD(P)-dependent oxidoreductase [Tomitella biformata]
MARLVRSAAALLLGPSPSLRAAVSTARRRHPDELAGTRVLITGASAGIGAATAKLLAKRGADVTVVARREDELQQVCAEIAAAGGTARGRVCDVTDGAQVDALVAQVLADGGVDVLVNNAGRSIRRSVLESVDRFHDYERTMAINYFAAVRLTLGLVPAMVEAGRGHVVNVATWGVPAGVMPRFSAYHGSKAAISAFTRSLGAELRGSGVDASAVSFPLIRTEMIAPTAAYKDQPALTAEQAAGWVLRALRTRELEIHPRNVDLLRIVNRVSPRLMDAAVRRAGI